MFSDKTEWLWWCLPGEHYTDKAPCACGAEHDEIVVLPPGTPPPADSVEAGKLGTVDDYEWPEEAYSDGS